MASTLKQCKSRDYPNALVNGCLKWLPLDMFRTGNVCKGCISVRQRERYLEGKLADAVIPRAPLPPLPALPPIEMPPTPPKPPAETKAPISPPKLEKCACKADIFSSITWCAICDPDGKERYKIFSPAEEVKVCWKCRVAIPPEGRGMCDPCFTVWFREKNGFEPYQPPGTRRCLDCKVVKPLATDYGVNYAANSKGGFLTRCKDCHVPRSFKKHPTTAVAVAPVKELVEMCAQCKTIRPKAEFYPGAVICKPCLVKIINSAA
jgi:hypothetical protein